MGLPQLRLALAAALAAQAAGFWDTCPQGPVGSCMELACSPTRGPTECDSGTCNCIAGYCRYPNFRIHAQPRRCRAQVPDSSCHLTRFCYKGGFVSSSCVQGRCLCRTGMHIGADGACHEGWYPSCTKDTGGTCSWFGCAASRGPTDCVSGHCLCKEGTCAVDGSCVSNTPPPNVTDPSVELAADPEVVRAEDWEVMQNVGAAAAFAGLSVAAVGSGALLLRRFVLPRVRGGGDFGKRLLAGETAEGNEVVG